MIRVLSLVEITAFRLESKSCKGFLKKILFYQWEYSKFQQFMWFIIWLILTNSNWKPPLIIHSRIPWNSVQNMNCTCTSTLMVWSRDLRSRFFCLVRIEFSSNAKLNILSVYFCHTSISIVVYMYLTGLHILERISYW